MLLSIWGQLVFSIFILYAWFGMLSKGMGETFLLSADEPLTPDIDGVMSLWIFKRRAQNTKNERKLVLSILVFIFPPPPPRRKFLPIILLRSSQAGGHSKKPCARRITTTSWIKIDPHGTVHFPIQIHFSALWGGDLTSFFGLRRTTEHLAS